MSTAEGQGFARGALSFSSIVALGAAVGLLVTPFTTRMFDPATLGKINMFGAYLALFQIVSLVGLDQGYMRFYSECPDPASRLLLLRHCLMRSVLVCSVVGLASWVLWEPISIGIVGGSQAAVPLILIAALLGSVVFRYAQVWSRVAGRAGDFLLLTMAFAVLTKVSVVVAGVVQSGYLGGILFLGVGYVLSGVYALWILRKARTAVATEVVTPPAARPLLAYSVPFLITGLLGLASTSLVAIPVERILGFEAVGVFYAGLSLASFVAVVQMGIQSYWSPYAYAVHRSGAGSLRAAQQAVALVICSVGLLCVAATPILFLLIGPAFRGAAEFFGLLVAPPVLALLGEVGGIGLLLAKRSWAYSASQAVGAVVTVACCLWLIPSCGLVGAGMAMTLGALVTAVLRITMARSSFRPFTRPSLAIATIALFLGAASLQAIPALSGGAAAVICSAVCLGVVLVINRRDVARIVAASRRELVAVLSRLRGGSLENQR